MGCATGQKKYKNKPTTVDFWFFFYNHGTHNLLIRQLLVYFSQEHSPAYLRLFWGNMVGLWRPLEVKQVPEGTTMRCKDRENVIVKEIVKKRL